MLAIGRPRLAAFWASVVPRFRDNPALSSAPDTCGSVPPVKLVTALVMLFVIPCGINGCLLAKSASLQLYPATSVLNACCATEGSLIGVNFGGAGAEADPPILFLSS